MKFHRAALRRFHGLTVLCSIPLALACNTIDTRMNAGYTGPRTYSGARQALGVAKQSFLSLNPPLLALSLADALFSSVADTFLLPLTIPEQSKLNTERTESLRLDVEQPGPLRVIANEEPLRTARRLYRECSSLALSLSSRFVNCYSIAAKIEITDQGGTEQLTGAEYKAKLREEFVPLQGTGRYARMKQPKYEEQPPNVVITAVREDSEDETRETIVWVVGPGADGEWRILEERGPGFP
jgi:hypothetical protein